MAWTDQASRKQISKIAQLCVKLGITEQLELHPMNRREAYELINDLIKRIVEKRNV